LYLNYLRNVVFQHPVALLIIFVYECYHRPKCNFFILVFVLRIFFYNMFRPHATIFRRKRSYYTLIHTEQLNKERYPHTTATNKTPTINN
jgi:hypothetical protein